MKKVLIENRPEVKYLDLVHNVMKTERTLACCAQVSSAIVESSKGAMTELRSFMMYRDGGVFANGHVIVKSTDSSELLYDFTGDQYNKYPPKIEDSKCWVYSYIGNGVYASLSRRPLTDNEVTQLEDVTNDEESLIFLSSEFDIRFISI